jgi:hypothetical protein
MRRNIYQMYVANGNRAGFYVRRNSWAGTYAQVVTVSGREAGPLSGRPPYYGDSPVTMDVYNLDGTVRAVAQQLSCPGTYTYAPFEPNLPSSPNGSTSEEETAMTRNIYQLYVANGNRAGFYVRRNSWAVTYAQVMTIGGREAGPLSGQPPYYGNPPVTMDIYNIHGTVRAVAQQLSSPGGYGYSFFEPDLPPSSNGPTSTAPTAEP